MTSVVSSKVSLRSASLTPADLLYPFILASPQPIVLSTYSSKLGLDYSVLKSPSAVWWYTKLTITLHRRTSILLGSSADMSFSCFSFMTIESRNFFLSPIPSLSNAKKKMSNCEYGYRDSCRFIRKLIVYPRIKTPLYPYLKSPRMRP